MVTGNELMVFWCLRESSGSVERFIDFETESLVNKLLSKCMLPSKSMAEQKRDRLAFSNLKIVEITLSNVKDNELTDYFTWCYETNSP